MPAPARFVLLLVALLTGAAIGCGGSTARDQNYGTNLGADFVAPIVDAGQDGATAGAAGSSNSGTAGAAGGTAGAAGGTAGAAGADVTGGAGADGAAGAGGTGS
jgi:hypothetical protein